MTKKKQIKKVSKSLIDRCTWKKGDIILLGKKEKVGKKKK